MAIEKEIVITVKEDGLDDVNKKVNQLEKSIESTSNAQTKSSKITKNQTDAVKELAPAATSTVQSLMAMGKAMWALVANPLGLVLAAIAATLAILFLAFKSFQPVVDKVEQVFAGLGAAVNVVKNAFIAVTTGTKSLGDAFSSLGSDMNDATKRTMDLVKAQQDLEDVMKSQEVTTAKNRAEINRLNVELRNRTLSEKERLKIADEIVKKENIDYLQRKKIVDEEVRQAREAIAIKAQFTKAEIKQLKERGDATKELAESRGGSFDEEYDRLNAARKKAIELEDEVTVNVEKAYNRRDKIQDDLNAKEESRLAKIAEANAKAKEARLKEQEDLLKEREEYLKKVDELNTEREDAEFNKKQKQKEQDKKDYDDALQAQVDKAENELAVAKNLDEEKKRIRNQEITDEELVRDAKFQIANSVFDIVNMFAKKGSKLAKGVAAAQATMNTYQGITAALAAPSTVPEPFGQALRIANAATIGVMGLMNVKRILSTNEQGSTSAPSAGGSAPQAPSFNLVQGTGRNQIAEGLNKQPVVKAYVVPTDVSTGQSLDRNIIKSASL